MKLWAENNANFGVQHGLIVLILMIATAVGGLWIANRSGGQKPNIQLELPNARWEPIFFQGIDDATQAAGIAELRTEYVPKDDIEVRVWRGFGLTPLEGILLKRTDYQWSAIYIRRNRAEDRTVEMRNLDSPKSGWEPFWISLQDKGILKLPDSLEVGCAPGQLDGIGYVVEINQGYKYRTYMYSQNGCPEAEQMRYIAKSIATEFDTGDQECKTAEWFPCTGRQKE